MSKVKEVLISCVRSEMASFFQRGFKIRLKFQKGDLTQLVYKNPHLNIKFQNLPKIKKLYFCKTKTSLPSSQYSLKWLTNSGPWERNSGWKTRWCHSLRSGKTGPSDSLFYLRKNVNESRFLLSSHTQKTLKSLTWDICSLARIFAERFVTGYSLIKIKYERVSPLPLPEGSSELLRGHLPGHCCC